MFVPAPRVVCTSKSPGNKAETIAAETMAAIICVTNKRPPRTQVSAPIRHIPSVTAGLNSPPLILKNVHAFTASEKPKAKEIYNTLEISVVVVITPELLVVFAICVAAKAKNRNRNVPRNSPKTATTWPREPLGRCLRKGSRAAALASSMSALLAV